MKIHNRRDFIKKSMIGIGGVCMSSSLLSLSSCAPKIKKESALIIDPNWKKITIKSTDVLFEREPLVSPFGFKGGFLSELWQVVVRLESDNGYSSIGLGVQSVLWSDSQIFSAYSETGGNSLMYVLTVRAVQMLDGMSFYSPIGVTDELFEELYAYGKRVTGNPNLRQTFVLNALVAVDNALWVLFARENGFHSFDQLIPETYQSAFSDRHEKLAATPLISYNVDPETIRREVESGYFFMKIKIGQPGTQEEMLAKDQQRLLEIHQVLKDIRTPYTETGKIPYYFDANGRYETEETFQRFLDYADKIKALDHFAIVEEPYPEDKDFTVKHLPVRIAADESAHTEKDAIERIEMGYQGMALKPIAKTLSVTMKIAKVSADHDIPCFCADLTVNPVMVEWNKNVAARLKSFPGLQGIGLLESNGHQNYLNWNKMRSHNPADKKAWTDVKNGFYLTDKEFFADGGGIFDPLPDYEKLFNKQ